MSFPWPQESLVLLKYSLFLKSSNELKESIETSYSLIHFLIFLTILWVFHVHLSTFSVNDNPKSANSPVCNWTWCLQILPAIIDRSCCLLPGWSRGPSCVPTLSKGSIISSSSWRKSSWGGMFMFYLFLNILDSS